MTYINKMWSLYNKVTEKLEGPNGKTPWIYASREDARDGKRDMYNSENFRVERVKVIVERRSYA